MTTNGNRTTANITTHPFPASRKVFVEGQLPGVRVPMREITLTPTKPINGGSPVPNEPIVVYDTSGPYTDPSVQIDLRKGLPAVRQEWILSRGDVEQLPEVTSEYGRLRAADPKLKDLRFQHIRGILDEAGLERELGRVRDALRESGHAHLLAFQQAWDAAAG